MTTRTTVLAAALILSSLFACARQQVIETTLDTMSDETRRETFHDMAAVFDDNPEWVDEFYRIALQHPPTLHRFLQNAADDLSDEELADVTGKLLAARPDSLRQVLISTVDAGKDEPEARTAINDAVRARNDTMTDIMTDDPKTMAAVFRALIRAAASDPDAQASLVGAMEKQADQVVELIASDPDLAVQLAKPILQELDADALAELLGEVAP